MVPSFTKKGSPKGWIRSSDDILSPDVPLTIANITSNYTELVEWADRNNYQLSPRDYGTIYLTEWTEIFTWNSFRIEKKFSRDNSILISKYKCPTCNTALEAGQLVCHNCGVMNSCMNCHIAGLKLYGTKGLNYRACARCSTKCSSSDCNSFVTPKDTESGLTKCSECEPRRACELCFVIKTQSDIIIHVSATKTYNICQLCFDTRICVRCKEQSNQLFPIDGQKTCLKCADAIYAEKAALYEKWPIEELPISGSLVIPQLKHRPVRTVSIETEFNGNREKCTRAFYVAGLIENRELSSYSAQRSIKDKTPCIIKGDSSVTGGELVTYLIDLDNENHAAALMRVTEVLRGCREMGYAEFTANAGGHIHIDLHGFTIGELWTLYTIFMYLQTPLYYLAGAGHSYGHRSLSDNTYGAPPAEGPFGDKKTFAARLNREMMQEGRPGLNLIPYFSQINMCGCGSKITGELDKCSCNLGKATAEWRLFNTQIVPRILHAWLALVQAVTAYSQDNEITTEASFPYLRWRQQHFSSLTSSNIKKVKERLEWIHRELPLTMEERDSIVYSCKESELIGLGVDYLNSLLQITPVNATDFKKDKPRNPSSRKGIKFRIKQQSEAA